MDSVNDVLEFDQSIKRLFISSKPRESQPKSTCVVHHDELLTSILKSDLSCSLPQRGKIFSDHPAFDQKDVISSVVKQVDSSHGVDFNTIDVDTISNAKDLSIASFFFLDAEETDSKSFELPGCVLLFGKLRFYEDNNLPLNRNPIDCSCCCVVKDIPRIIYLLPKNLYSNDNFVTCYEEFNRIANTFHILEFSSRIVIKSVCFTNHNIPPVTQFLEIRYSRIYPKIPNNLECVSFVCFSDTFENVLETLLVQNGIKGPCWLNLLNFTILSSSTFSCCKISLSLHGLDNVVVQILQPSPPRFLALSLCVKYIEANTSESNKEIVILAYCIDKNRQIEDLALNHSFGPYVINVCDIYNNIPLQNELDANEVAVGKDITIIFHKDECSLLMQFCNQLYDLNPDFIFGHDTIYWLDLIYARAQFHQISKFSFIEKLKRKTHRSCRKPFHSTISFGRVIFDLCHSSKEFIKLDSYEISSISSFVINQSHVTLSHTQVKDILLESTDRVIHLIENAITESELILLLENELNIIKLAYQLTILAGNILSRTLLGGRAERNDYLLLHAFHSSNYILPQKPTLEDKSEYSKHIDSHTNKRSTFSGGLVFEPKKGLYNTFTLVLDFNSLYPSLIQEYNICFSTIAVNCNEYSCVPPGNSKNLGVIPQELQLLVNKRKEIKLQMKNVSLASNEYNKLNIRQKAIKLTSNSIYGCLGYSQSRFFARSLASLVTSLGREVLNSTKYFVENQFGLEVIYGDTDSIMIDTKLTNINQVKSLGNQLKSKINDLHSLLEIDIESIYRRLLLLRKKKYAALSVKLSNVGEYTETIDIKGLDIIRRDWCRITKKCGHYVVETILNNNDDTLVQKLRDYLSAFSENVRNNIYDHDEFIIYKTLNKLPEEYADCNAYPHVAVAKWLKHNGGICSIGHVIPYVICIDGTCSNPLRRAYHPDRLRKPLAVYDSQLCIDKEYYLSNQIFPVISRLCAPLIDSKVISEFLGLHSLSFSKECFNVFNDKQSEKVSATEFSINCPHCKIHFVCVLPAVSNSFITCSNCFLEICYQKLLFSILLDFRERIKVLYFREQKCSEFFCSFITKDFNFIMNFESPYNFCFKCNQGTLKSLIHPFSICEQLDYLCIFYSSIPSLFQTSFNIFTIYSSFNTICLLDLF